jgi:hypothetical protein
VPAAPPVTVAPALPELLPEAPAGALPSVPLQPRPSSAAAVAVKKVGRPRVFIVMFRCGGGRAGSSESFGNDTRSPLSGHRVVFVVAAVTNRSMAASAQQRHEAAVKTPSTPLFPDSCCRRQYRGSKWRVVESVERS